MATSKAPAKKAAPKKKAPPPVKPPAKRQRVDWDALEPHYRAGIRALADMAKEFGCTDAAIIKHARKEGWTRNLQAKIQAKADAKVSAALVSAEVSAQTKITEKVTVEVESTVRSRIHLAHRRDIGRGRDLTMKLLAELESQTADPGLFDQLGELMVEPDGPEDSEAKKERQRKLREAYNRVLSLPGRADTLKKLADSLRILIDKEREAFGMESKAGGGGGGGGDDPPPSKTLSDAERASRLAALLERARQSAANAASGT